MGFLTGKTVLITGAGRAVLKDGINVNVVCPLAWTAKFEQFKEAYPDAFKANVKMPPMGHYGNACFCILFVVCLVNEIKDIRRN